MGDLHLAHVSTAARQAHKAAVVREATERKNKGHKLTSMRTRGSRERSAGKYVVCRDRGETRTHVWENFQMAQRACDLLLWYSGPSRLAQAST